MLPKRLYGGGLYLKYQVRTQVIGAVVSVTQSARDTNGVFQLSQGRDFFHHSASPLAHNVVLMRQQSRILEEHQQGQGLGFAFPQIISSNRRNDPRSPLTHLLPDLLLTPITVAPNT